MDMAEMIDVSDEDMEENIQDQVDVLDEEKQVMFCYLGHIV